MIETITIKVVLGFIMQHRQLKFMLEKVTIEGTVGFIMQHKQVEFIVETSHKCNSAIYHATQ